ncbi:unnamed protein product [Parnassius apollo]|uniref:(apollo) hypothetical protein n=1 Tax=Parnassius apollo TaxID=110799 RepID=A0A8S3XLJ9_PARAO|nr:unnamed protein product [Parnassius apollo]
MLRISKLLLNTNLKYYSLDNVSNGRTFKNFGHKRQPVPRITVLWHGFLTFSFIGLGIEWKRIGRMIFGEDFGKETETSPFE